MKTHRLRAGLSLACSAVVIGTTLGSLAVFFLRTGDGNMAVHGTLAFRYFTVDSNILCALACAGLIPGIDLEMVVIGGIMLFIPGLALVNGVREMFYADILTGVYRVIEACLGAGAIAVGYAAALMIGGGVG